MIRATELYGLLRKFMCHVFAFLRIVEADVRWIWRCDYFTIVSAAIAPWPVVSEELQDGAKIYFLHKVPQIGLANG